MEPYFTFSKNERIGAVTIGIIITILLVVLNVDNRVGLPDPFVIEESKYLIDTQDSVCIKSKYSFKKDTVLYFKFNPNEFSQTQWEKFDFSPKQAKAIVKYKIKIGGFKKKSDLKKVYVIDEKKYLELEPYISIPSVNKELIVESHIGVAESETSVIAVELLELNSASKDDLIKLKGIGEFTAKGIIQYKTKLGGYHSVDQLLEVYGVSPENLVRIKGQISIDKTNLTKINVNKLSISDLKKHPYISWTIASKIIDKRLGGKLIDLSFLKEEGLMSAKELNLLLPYITF